MPDLVDPVHLVLLLFTYVIPIALFVWAVERISRAIEGRTKSRDGKSLERNG